MFNLHKKREPMRALVAVYAEADGTDSCLLEVWPPAKGPDDPWGCEFEAIGDRCLDNLGLKYPKSTGLWVWEGSIYYPGPNYEGICDDGPVWQGNWRRAKLNDVETLLDLEVDNSIIHS